MNLCALGGGGAGARDAADAIASGGGARYDSWAVVVPAQRCGLGT